MESTAPPTSELIRVNGSLRKEDVDEQVVEAVAEYPVVSLKSERLPLTSAQNPPNDRFVGSLPLEIASYIFELYFEVQEDAPDLGSVFRLHPVTDAPFRLGAVCRTWRAIAWSSPALWTTLSICLYSTRNNLTLELAKQWLARTKSLPLSIRIYESIDFEFCNRDDDSDSDSDSDSDEVEMDYIEEMIQMVKSVCSRWRNLDLELPSYLLDRFAMYGSHFKPSILRQASLYSTDEGYPITDFLFHNRCCFPTRLYLANVGVEVGFDTSSWMHLTSFEAHCMDVEDCLQVIRAATSLKELILNYVIAPFTSILPVTHLNLSLLVFVRTPAPDANALLDVLTLPSLKSIMIRDFEHDLDHGITESLILLIRRSSCPLKVLRPPPCFDADHKLRIRLLQTTPSLQTLNFQYDCNHSGCFEKVLTMKREDSTFLSHLEIFEIEMTSHSNIYGWERILANLESNQNVASGRIDFNVLRSLKFRFILPGPLFRFNQHFLQRFTGFISRGLDISIECQGEDVIAESLAFHYPPEENL